MKLCWSVVRRLQALLDKKIDCMQMMMQVLELQEKCLVSTRRLYAGWYAKDVSMKLHTLLHM